MTSETLINRWSIRAVAVLLATLMAPAFAQAQNGASARVPAPPTDQIPTAGPFEPMTVANVVHSWRVLAVTAGGALEVDAGGEAVELELWPVTLPPQTDPAGERARQYLTSLIGRKVQFSFHRHEDLGAGGLSQPPSRRAYADVVDVLVRRGLARYCPDSGVRLGELERLEREAREHKRGLWSAASPPSCPQ